VVGVPFTQGSSSSNGAADSGSSFGGFAHAGSAAATPTGFNGAAPTAPYAPPVVLQQQQQVVPPSRPIMSADLYPNISKG
jgi:hypothetical protein